MYTIFRKAAGVLPSWKIYHCSGSGTDPQDNKTRENIGFCGLLKNLQNLFCKGFAG
jgi:hypothetical protein